MFLEIRGLMVLWLHFGLTEQGEGRQHCFFQNYLKSPEMKMVCWSR